MRRLVVTLLVIGALVAGVVYWWTSRSRGPGLTEDSFGYAPAEFGTLRDTVSATGAVKPREVVAVGSELSGKVLDLYANVGDSVREGDALLRLDDEEARLKLRQAQDNVRAADVGIEQAKDAERAAQDALDYQQSLENNGGFRGEVKKARAQLNAAKSGVKLAQVKKAQAQTLLDLARLGVEKTIVRVPRAREEQAPGAALVSRDRRLTPVAARQSPSARRRYVVLDRKVVLGQLIGPPVSAQLFTLAADLGEMEVHAQVAEADIAKVRKGLRATFTVSAYADAKDQFPGEVLQIRPMPSSPTNFTGVVYYDTVIKVNNSPDPKTGEWRLRPGMTASVDVIFREHHDVWKVPTAALTFQPDEHYLTPAAQAKLEEWQKRKDADDWKPVWVWDAKARRPWPVFVRVGGRGPGGETGIKDNQFNEVLEWEPGRKPKGPRAAPKLIISQPQYHQPGLFELPKNIKLG